MEVNLFAKIKSELRILMVGAAMGVANIIPGVSGGTIAVVFGIYEQLMEALGNFYLDKQKRLEYVRFLAVLFLGSVLAIVGLAQLLSWCFENYPLATVYFFIGLILGSIPVVLKTHDDMKANIGRVAAFLISFVFVIVLAVMQDGSDSAKSVFDHTIFGFADYLFYFLSGAIAASAMIIPGVSGSFILLLLGIYWNVLSSLSGLTSTLFEQGFIAEMRVRLYLLGSLGIGVVIGILLISKLMSWLLKKYPAPTFYAILGLIIGSIYQILSGVDFQYNFPALITMIIGIIISLKFGKD